MARRRKSIFDYFRLPSVPSLGLDRETKKGIFVVIILAIGAISLLALFNLAGTLGVYLKGWLMLLFGWGRWVMPFVLLFLGYALFKEDKYKLKAKNYLGLIFLILSLHALFFVFINEAKWALALKQGSGGGYTGFYIAQFFIKYTGLIVSFVILLATILVSMQLTFSTSVMRMFGPDSLIAKFFSPFNWLVAKIFKRGEEETPAEEEIKEAEESEETEIEEEEKEGEGEETEEEDNQEKEGEADASEAEVGEEPESAFTTKEIKEVPQLWWQKPTGIQIKLLLSLLDDIRGKVESGNIDRNKEVIKKALMNFNIPVEMGDVSVGPTFTRYTFKPAEGIKLSRITNLSSDLALALALHPIRIEAPIPNTSLVGVEVPNIARAIVSLKGMLASRDFRSRESNMIIPMGRDVVGKPWFGDLLKMPHLLVAGATNSGKSVCLNSIIVSLMFQNSPDDLRFILIDPKRGVELSDYDNIPYLLTPVVSDLNKAVNTLIWCVNEMDHRYQFLRENKFRKIQDYNSAAKVKMPYIIVIIDELAELMLTSVGRQIENSATRLTQLGRAAGIHIIVATQKPIITVITSLIKSNITARIAFQVATNVDSRTILDHSGAEKLLGSGDMLYLGAEMRRPIRLQGACITGPEIRRVTDYIRAKKKNNIYLQEIEGKQRTMGMSSVGSGASDSGESMLEEAKAVILNIGKASASLLQRKLGIGYARAARILDILEEEGFIGPGNGAKPREILVSKEEYQAGLKMGVSEAALHERSRAEAPEEYFADEDEDEVEDTPPVFTNEGEESEDEKSVEDIEENADEESEDEIENGFEDEAGDEDEKNEEEEIKGESKNEEEKIREKPKNKKIEHDDMPEKLFSR